MHERVKTEVGKHEIAKSPQTTEKYVLISSDMPTGQQILVKADLISGAMF